MVVTWSDLIQFVIMITAIVMMVLAITDKRK